MRRICKFFILLLVTAAILCGCGQGSTAENFAPVQSVSEAQNGLKLTQESTVSKEKYLKESDFETFLSLSEQQFVIPGLKQATVPQGIAYSDTTGLIYISSYYTIELPSVISAVNAETGELCAEYFLYNEDGSIFQSHVGGTAVCGDTLYVSAKLDNDGSYSMAAINLSELPAEGSHEITVKDFVTLPVSPSFLNCSGGFLWAGNFFYPSADYGLSPEMNYLTGDYGCYIVGYAEDRDLLAEEGTYPIPDVVLAVTDRIQGFCVLPDDSILLSQSYGRKNNSTLLHYSLDLSAAPDTQLTVGSSKVPAYVLGDDRLLDAVCAMPMTEGLCNAPDGGVLVLFESGALRYEDGLFRTDKVWELRFYWTERPEM